MINVNVDCPEAVLEYFTHILERKAVGITAIWNAKMHYEPCSRVFNFFCSYSTQRKIGRYWGSCTFEELCAFKPDNQ